jgi:hypothetical protein
MIIMKRTERLEPAAHSAHGPVFAHQGDDIDRVFYGG